MKHPEIFLAIILLFAKPLTSCRLEQPIQAEKTGSFTAAVWNVQSLFDGEDTGNEYAEFRAASGWTKEKYAARILAIEKAVTGMIPGAAGTSTPQAPDFLCLVEIENLGILKDLANGQLAKYGYAHMYFGNAAGMSLGVGVLSRYKLTETKVHSITMNSQTIPRPLLEVHIEPEGEPLVFFLCHWKSKLGGEDATELLRQASARVIARRIRELQTEKPGAPVIVMGDLNENHDEFYRRGRISALLPDDPQAAALAAAALYDGFLILSSEKPPRTQYFDPEHPVLYTPWENELSKGSYYFRDNWETIDHILMSAELFDNTGWDFESCKVLHFPPFTNSKGFPNYYNPGNSFGMSDHLPLLLWLSIRE